jgi:hypothetical protein
MASPGRHRRDRARLTAKVMLVMFWAKEISLGSELKNSASRPTVGGHSLGKP